MSQLMLFEAAEMEKKSREEKYVEFTGKFEGEKTTDDCYTPPEIFEVIADWACREYGFDKSQIVRPFWPGGDFERFEYAKDCVVVDNPPFSILAKILDFFNDRGIKYFLFAPTLTLFSSSGTRCCCIPCGVAVTYENGAKVNTSFVTNLDRWKVRTAPDLYRIIEEADKRLRTKDKKTLPKYEYPDYVITSALVAKWCKYGIDYRLASEDCRAIEALDEQKMRGKAIFGKGFLLSERAAAERAAAERAAAERWHLSEREWAIVRELGGAS